jgi:hypothetical protein
LRVLLTCILGACLVPLPFVVASLPAGSQPQVERLRALLVRPTFTQEYGVERPTDVAFDPGRNALVVAAPESGAPVISLKPGGELLATHPPVAIEPRTLAFGRVNARIAAVSGDDVLGWSNRSNTLSERVPLRGRPSADVSSATFDDSGALTAMIPKMARGLRMFGSCQRTTSRALCALPF